VIHANWTILSVSYILKHRYVANRDSGFLLTKLHSNATVTHSRISNWVHTISKPYRPGFTRIDPHRNPCQFLWIPWLRYNEQNGLVMFKKFCKDFNSVLISVLNRFESHWSASTRIDPCHISHDIHSHDPDLIRVKMSRMGGNLCYSHTHPDFEPGPYGIKPVSTQFHPYWPGSTGTDPHRNMCQFLRIPGATTRRVQNFCASQTI
jgi:hypothetical protein